MLDMRDLSVKLAEATKNMSESERASLLKLFEGVSKDMAKEAPNNGNAVSHNDGGIPNGMTERLKKLK